MKKNNRNLSLVLSLLVLSFSTFAQYSKTRFKPYTSIGVVGGSSVYYGDLALFNELKTSFGMARWQGGIDVTRHIKPNFSARLHAKYIRIAGDDWHSPNDARFLRNLRFRNNMQEIGISGQYELADNGNGYKQRENIVPYITAGVAYLHHQPQAQFGGYDANFNVSNVEWTNLQALGTEGQQITGSTLKPYSLHTVSVPLGVGVKKRLKNRLDVSFELTYHLSFSKYLDDVNGNYGDRSVMSVEAGYFSNKISDAAGFAKHLGQANVDYRDDRTSAYKSTLTGAEITNLGAAGTPRGSGTGNDSYLLAGVRLSYILANERVKCPKMPHDKGAKVGVVGRAGKSKAAKAPKTRKSRSKK